MMLSGFCFSLKKNVCERFLCPMPLKSSPTISYSSISFHSSINQAQPYHYEGVPKRLICLFVCFFFAGLEQVSQHGRGGKGAGRRLLPHRPGRLFRKPRRLGAAGHGTTHRYGKENSADAQSVHVVNP